ncbi:MAG: acylphosphatase [Gammaproteobacteria bacterium]|nr:acylphosphatase [Gammaproteobacteria bacterium]
MTETCIHCLVSGRVQGVSFRAYTRKAALQLGLAGWVRNLRDGRVEIKVCGDTQQVERLVKWLPDGIPAARIDRLTKQTIPAEQFSGFDILADA